MFEQLNSMPDLAPFGPEWLDHRKGAPTPGTVADDEDLASTFSQCMYRINCSWIRVSAIVQDTELVEQHSLHSSSHSHTPGRQGQRT